jgi:dipeptidyl aminopeptidase/acylaminoacyl peptidase
MRVSLRRWVPGLVTVAFVCAASTVALAQDKDPANGTWKLNVAKSKFSPGPAPKEMTVTIESAGAGRHVEANGATADGAPLKWGYSGNYDRKDIRVTGSNPDADVVMLRRLSPTTVRSTYKKDGKQTLVNGVSVSADGKTLSVAQSGVNAKGQTVKNTLVFDKQ